MKINKMIRNHKCLYVFGLYGKEEISERPDVCECVERTGDVIRTAQIVDPDASRQVRRAMHVPTQRHALPSSTVSTASTSSTTVLREGEGEDVCGGEAGREAALHVGERRVQHLVVVGQAEHAAVVHVYKHEVEVLHGVRICGSAFPSTFITHYCIYYSLLYYCLLLFTLEEFPTH